ncbi:hypothetical protein [Priestia aryabhattai]|uniref:hypothetical protein n=1 Tax=Priestia aryabhattai TaxID=412384 RepID=UPI001C8DE126|nr:hypothetical protein [Priestia aryabhattai]MBX9987156.1 hypothetical protein [Priestia aryabhattai]
MYYFDENYYRNCYEYYYQNPFKAPMSLTPQGNSYIVPLYWRQHQHHLLTVPEVSHLAGKRIRTTLPNITGSVTATVGRYNSSTNRVQLINIISDRTGVNYGDLSYLPEEISGLQVLGESTTQPDPTQTGTTQPGPTQPGPTQPSNTQPIPFYYEIWGPFYLKGNIYSDKIIVDGYAGPARISHDEFKLDGGHLKTTSQDKGSGTTIDTEYWVTGRTLHMSFKAYIPKHCPLPGPLPTVCRPEIPLASKSNLVVVSW